MHPLLDNDEEELGVCVCVCSRTGVPKGREDLMDINLPSFLSGGQALCLK